MEPVIDVHTHLGDILYPGGGSLIEMTGVKKARIFDPISISEAFLHRDLVGGQALQRIMGDIVTRAERARNFTATRENCRKSMDEAGVTYTACMPIAPYVTFADLRKAAAKDAGIIPFTSVDYSRIEDVQALLGADVAAGARGLKLHATIQNIPLTSRETFAAVEAFAPHGLPVLFHCGYSSYYMDGEKYRENPSYSEIPPCRDLVKAFPGVNFIAGHAGLFQVREVISLLSAYPNVSVDISFQPPEKIRELVASFGPERVMYGTDWPWGSRKTAMKAVKIACSGDGSLERKIFHDNAARLLKMAT
ncbi:MAG TPA: amidohydrolase family protein [Deltaproteobacteria bacterium]|nr:amidohydrolase family protein [Deltaproteobacteria bacterium]HXK46676.1 amidohydrolase family protein [Deltaproteobacteria bacterium]